MSELLADEKRLDIAAIMRQLYCATAMYDTLSFPLRVQRDYFRTLFRRRMMWVRNWQATPMIVDSKAKWMLTYERRRFLRWIPVQVAVVDTLDECFALVKHRRQEPMKFGMNDDGNVTGTTTWKFNIKVDRDASDELRPKGADHGATAAGGAGEESSESPETSWDRETKSRHSPQEQGADEREGWADQEAASEVSGDSASVLEGGKR